MAVLAAFKNREPNPDLRATVGEAFDRTCLTDREEGISSQGSRLICCMLQEI